MIVCLCHRVSDRDIAHAAGQGCGSFDQLQEDLRVATACGACGECARELFDDHRAACPGRGTCGAAGAAHARGAP